MATITKRNNGYAVIYRGFKDGKRKQIWETYKTKEEATTRLKQLEIGEKKKSMTIKDLMKFYVDTYGAKRWSPKTYEDKTSRINNYILPLLANYKISKLKAIELDQYFSELERMDAIMGNGHKPKGIKVSPRTIKEVYILLKGAFDQALKYDLIEKNPVNHILLPEVKTNEREIWEINTFLEAISKSNLIIDVIINLCFSLTGRYGEIGGLLWENVFISDDEPNPYILIKTELIRWNKKAVQFAKEKEIMYEFPSLKDDDAKTTLVISTPKTEKSIRKVWIPKTVASKLNQLKERQEQMKLALGSEYTDFGLVITQDNGRPVENKLFNKWLKKLCKDNNLPIITSHAFRHLGATIKYDLTGNLIVVQGDTGHRSSKVLTDTYLHSSDSQRQGLAMQIEKSVYGVTENIEDKIYQRMSQDPEFKEKLKAFLASC